MDKTDQRALRIAEKLKQLEERVQTKVEKLGYQSQFEELKKQGFSNIRFILRALKKCKGDLTQAIELLQTFADKANEMPQNDADTAAGEQQVKEKKWMKFIKKRNEEKSPEEIPLKKDQQEKEPVKDLLQEPTVGEKESNPSEKKWKKYLKKRDEEKSPEDLEKKERKIKKDLKKSDEETDEGIQEKKEEKQPKEKKWLKYIKQRKDEEQTDDAEIILKHYEDKSEKSEERKQVLRVRKFEKMNELFPEFPTFNETMKKLGFEEDKKNFNALKKHNGDQEKAKAHLIRKKILEELELCKTLEKGQFQRIFLDCNNCFYLETSFLKKAIKGNFQAIEEQIATLMKIFQNNYKNVEIVLVFDDSKLLKDQKASKMFYSTDFSMITAKPDFESADDAMVALAGTETEESIQNALFVTSDRQLQARLVEQKAKHIMASKNFFNIMKEEVVGKKDYVAIIDV